MADLTNIVEYEKAVKDKYCTLEFWCRYVHNGEPTNMLISSLGNIRFDKKNEYRKRKIRVIGRHYCTRVNLLSDKSKRKTVLISRMVAIMFIPIPERYLEQGLTYKDLEADHIDAKCKWDNSVFNLQWLTPAENKLKARINKEHVYCEDRPNTSLTNDQVKKACKMLEENKLDLHDISKATKIPVDTLYYIKIKRCWTEISKHYKIENYDRIKGRNNSQQKIHDVCKLLEENKYSYKEIAQKTGVSASLVNNIKNKHRWVSISKYYDF